MKKITLLSLMSLMSLVFMIGSCSKKTTTAPASSYISLTYQGTTHTDYLTSQGLAVEPTYNQMKFSALENVTNNDFEILITNGCTSGSYPFTIYCVIYITIGSVNYSSSYPNNQSFSPGNIVISLEPTTGTINFTATVYNEVNVSDNMTVVGTYSGPILTIQ
jgi:hypothetical protein